MKKLLLFACIFQKYPVYLQYKIREQWINLLNTSSTEPRDARESIVYCGRTDIEWKRSETGNFVKEDDGTYLDIVELKGRIKQKDIDEQLRKIRSTYEDRPKYSWDPEANEKGSFVPDASGSYIYDSIAREFVDISK